MRELRWLQKPQEKINRNMHTHRAIASADPLAVECKCEPNRCGTMVSGVILFGISTENPIRHCYWGARKIHIKTG